MVAVGPATGALPGENNEQARKDQIYIVRRVQLGTHQAAPFELK